MRILLGIILVLFIAGCQTFERNPKDFKRVAHEQKLVRVLNPTGKAEEIFAKLKNYVSRCFHVSGSVTRVDGMSSVTIINEQRAQFHTYSQSPFYGDIHIRWYTKPNEPINDGNIFFLTEVRDGGSGKAKISFYGNKIFNNDRYFENFSAVVAGKNPEYCPGK